MTLSLRKHLKMVRRQKVKPLDLKLPHFLFKVPSAAPTDLEATAVSLTAIEVTWTALLERDRNGLIWYSVEFAPTSSQMEYSTIVTTSTSVTLERLQIFTEYSVRLRAETSVGSGPSAMVLVTTFEGGIIV